MLLQGVKKRIFINAGHFDSSPNSQGDSGVIIDGLIERDEVKKIRDFVVKMLQESKFEVVVIPDNLNLRQSIDLVNKTAKNLNDGLALDLHLNSGGSAFRKKSGVEIYVYPETISMKIGRVLSRNIARTLNISDRGAKSDGETAVGSLGWCRQVNCWPAVIEVLFLDYIGSGILGWMRDKLGQQAIIRNKQYSLIALGICAGVKELYGENYSTPAPEIPQDILQSIKSQLDKILEALQKLRIKKRI